jgi:cysteine-S-conjugate beta-lyase
VVLTNKATKSAVTKTHHNLGCCPGPDDVYLAQRGLRTLQARMAVHQKAALEMAEFLSGMPEVVRVLHPALPSCPGHAQFMRDFSGSNGLFSVILKPHSQKALAAMFNGMELFGMGYSWGGFESLMIPCNLRLIRSHPSVPEDHHLIRLHIGLEDLEDLKADLKAGFERLREAA